MAQESRGASEQLAERLDRVEARFAVADLVHAYARLIRRDQPDEAAALFLPEGSFEIRDGYPDRGEYRVRTRLEGRAQIDAYLAPGKGKPHPVPLIRNLMIEVDGDSATANSVMDAQIYGSDVKVRGEYRDSFARVDGRWYFAARAYTIYKEPPAG